MKVPSLVPVPVMRSQTVSSVGGQVLDMQFEVGERAPQRGDHGLDALGAGGVVGAEVLVLDHFG